MKFIPNNIKAIIFDLGGVVLNLNPQKTIEAFARLTGYAYTKVAAWADEPLFKQYEKGEISSNQFRNGLRALFRKNLPDSSIDTAWNAMLLDLPLARLQLISSLRPAYQTFVLSNTNPIHIEAFDNIVAQTTGGNRIQTYFDKVYYSHQAGMRKPDAEIFEMVLENHGLAPQHTLFIDDTLEHIQSAASLGLNTWHLINQEELQTVLAHEKKH